MKLTPIFTVLIFSCLFGQAQSNNEMSFQLEETHKIENIQKLESKSLTIPVITNENNMEISRLHKHKNNRVIKALNFTIKTNKPKMA